MPIVVPVIVPSRCSGSCQYLVDEDVDVGEWMGMVQKVRMDGWM